MTLLEIPKRVVAFSTAIIFALSTLTFVVPAQNVSAALIDLPEPVAPSANCEWMGEVHYEDTRIYYQESSTLTNDLENYHNLDMTSAPVAGVDCGMRWSSEIRQSSKAIHPAVCTADPNDMNTRNTLAEASGYGAGSFIFNQFDAGTINPGMMIPSLSTSGSADTTSTLHVVETNTLCGGNTDRTALNNLTPYLDFTLSGCANAQVGLNEVTLTGFYTAPGVQAVVGHCLVHSFSNTPTSHHDYVIELSWRFKKVNCNPAIDSDGGGTSDCQEYEDKTNPMEDADDVQHDSTAPTITLNTPLNGGTVLLGSAATANFSCQDETGGSGLKSCTSSVTNGAALDTSSVGQKTFVITAEDNAGNTYQATASYTVAYQSSGLMAPLDTNAVNKAKAGSNVPVKFRLTDASGNPISTSTSFTSVTSSPTSCNSNDPTDVVEEAPSNSGLQYLGDGYWQYNWKTPKTYAGTCRIVSLNLADGSHTTVKFQF